MILYSTLFFCTTFLQSQQPYIGDPKHYTVETSLATSQFLTIGLAASLLHIKKKWSS